MAKVMWNGKDLSAPTAGGSSGVSGVKGNEEEAYRTGQVNITPENIGAAKSSIYGTNIKGYGRISFGTSARATGENSQAVGYYVQAYGNMSHAQNEWTTASGQSSSAEGYFTIASNYASHSSGKYTKSMIEGGSFDNQIGDVFVIGNGTSSTSRSNALRITYQGDVLGTKAFQSSGADYAEFIKPWADGNPDNEDRIGYFVTIKNGCLEKANEGDCIAGITSGNPSVVGNSDEDYYWRYERDELNRIVMEDVPETVQQTEEVAVMVQDTDLSGNLLFDESGEPVMVEVFKETPVFDPETHEPVMIETGRIIKNARMKLAENYDPSLQESYIPRKDRPEWDCVGMIGVLPVRDDGTCVPGQLCKCSNGGIATLAEERSCDAYMVIERMSRNVVSVIMR